LPLLLSLSATAPVALADTYAGHDPLQEVVVSASALPKNADALATTVGSVDRDQILQQGGSSLADALGNQPGVTGSTFAAGASRPVIRGFDSNRVRVLEDGIGSFDVSDVGPDHGVPIDPLSAKRIEVVRGAATLRYGSQAIGGVVNAVNDRVPTELPEAPLAGEVSGSYATGASAREGAALLDGRVGHVALHADGFERHTDDYDIPGGTQPNSFFRGDGFAGGGSVFFGDNDASRVGVGAVHYDARYGIPSDVTYIDMQQTKYLTRSSFAIGAGPLQTVTAEGGYADYIHRERLPTGETVSTFQDHEWDGRSEALFGAMGPFDSTALGVQVQKKHFAALGEGASYLLPTTTRSSAAFVFTEVPFSERLRLQTGARLEQVTIDGTPASGEPVTRHFSPASASLGFLYDPVKAVRLGLTVSSAARAPGQTELFARGPHDGPGTFETGDPTLAVERANSVEATLRVREGRVRVEGSLWAARFRNYIYGELTGRTCDEGGVCGAGEGELRELVYRQVNATFRGAEAKATVTLLDAPAGGLSGEVIADYVRATLSEGGNVPRIPPYHVAVGLHWDGERVDGGFLVRYTGRQDDVAFAETPTGGYANLDAHVGWRPVPSVQLELVGRNLTNATQRNAISLNKELVVLPGRDARLLVRWTF
jgi:iron complex outermembrane receptor protein